MRTNESDSTKKRTTPAKRTRRATTAATPRTRTRKTSPKPSAPPDDDQIRHRAYELYLQRNGFPGDPMEDWLRAERELSEQRG